MKGNKDLISKLAIAVAIVLAGILIAGAIRSAGQDIADGILLAAGRIECSIDQPGEID